MVVLAAGWAEPKVDPKTPLEVPSPPGPKVGSPPKVNPPACPKRPGVWPKAGVVVLGAEEVAAVGVLPKREGVVDAVLVGCPNRPKPAADEVVEVAPAPDVTAEDVACVPKRPPEDVVFPKRDVDAAWVAAGAAEVVDASDPFDAFAIEENRPELPNDDVTVDVVVVSDPDTAAVLGTVPKRLRAAGPGDAVLLWEAPAEAPVGKVTPLRMLLVDCCSLALSSSAVEACDLLSSMPPRRLPPEPGLSNMAPSILEDPDPVDGLAAPVPASSVG